MSDAHEPIHFVAFAEKSLAMRDGLLCQLQQGHGGRLSVEVGRVL